MKVVREASWSDWENILLKSHARSAYILWERVFENPPAAASLSLLQDVDNEGSEKRTIPRKGFTALTGIGSAGCRSTSASLRVPRADSIRARTVLDAGRLETPVRLRVDKHPLQGCMSNVRMSESETRRLSRWRDRITPRW